MPTPRPAESHSGSRETIFVGPLMGWCLGRKLPRKIFEYTLTVTKAENIALFSINGLLWLEGPFFLEPCLAKLVKNP